MYLLADCTHTKHYACLVPLLKYWNSLGVEYYFEGQKYIPDTIRAVICFNKLDPIKYTNIKTKYPSIPFVVIDHGCSNLKWFLNDFERYSQFDIFLTPGIDHTLSMRAIFGYKPEKQFITTAFANSEGVLKPSTISREELCKMYNLDSSKPIVLYAPTWFKKMTPDHVIITEQLAKYKNHIISAHKEALTLGSQFCQPPTIEIVKHANLIISDTSSILVEALVINKPVLQVLMREYSDNPATNYSLPISAGTLTRFRSGSVVTPERLYEKILDLLENPEQNQYRIDAIKGINISQNATKIINDELEKSIDIYYSSHHNKTRNIYAKPLSEYDKIRLVIKAFHKVMNRGPMSSEIVYHQKYILPDGSTRVLELVLQTSFLAQHVQDFI